MASSDLITKDAPVRPPSPGQSSITDNKQQAVIACLLAALVIWTFFPVLKCDFTNFDDPQYVTANWHVQQGLSWQNIHWAFTNLGAGFWQPLTWLSYLLDYQLYGLHAAGFHFTNLILHAACTVLLFLALARITGALWRSAMVAALFGVHPLHVESVAWIAERKDVLSTLFWMLALWAYACYAEKLRTRNHNAGLNYSLMLVFFLFGLMSKTMVMTLPLVLLLLDYWPLTRFAGAAPLLQNSANTQPFPLFRLLLEKIPLLALGVLSALLTFHTERTGVIFFARYTLSQRIANTIVSCLWYPMRMFWPADLAVLYPYPKSFSIILVAGSLASSLLISAIALGQARCRPYLVVGWLWYLVTLLPVSGLIQIGVHARADRYTYLPLIGIFLLVVWGICEIAQRFRVRAIPLSTIGGAVICTCAILSRDQLVYWRNNEALFRHTIAVTDGNYIAHHNLAAALYNEGKLPEAAEQYAAALAVKPDFAESIAGQAAILEKQGHHAEAIQRYEDTLRINPNQPEANYAVGLELENSGNLKEAMIHYQAAVHANPDFAEAHNNLGILMGRLGLYDEALAQLSEAATLKPDSSEIHYNLGNALVRKNLLDGAITQFQQALKLGPASADLHINLGVALARQQRFKEAIAELQEALRLKPDSVEARRDLEALQGMKGAQ